MENHNISKLIDSYFEKKDDEVRNYIGASSIGSECLRQIWYQYKGMKGEAIPAKTRRTWEIGKNLEGLIIRSLVNAGIEVFTTDKTFFAKDAEFFQGHVDAIVTFKNNKAILEIKTAKDSSFNIFKNKGLRVWNPQYYAQIQSYMGMSEINSAYILVLNKDNSELFDEFVKFDPDFYKRLLEKAKIIYKAKIEPPKINSSPLWYLCRMCKFNKECHS